MKNVLIIGMLSLLLSGCARPYSSAYVDGPNTSGIASDYKYSNYNRVSSDYANYYYLSTNYQNNPSAFSGGYYSQYGYRYKFIGNKSLLLADIVSSMAEQLLYNLPTGYFDEAIAITSLVNLSDHSQTNWLGQTISELFIHELHIRHLPIIDYKLTGSIKVTPEGEFAITRNWKELNANVDVSRILTGTMSRNEEGVILNVRIVNSITNLVESTTRAYLPHSLFVGGKYDYSNRKYFLRDSRLVNKVKLVK
jgi:TolB-like protein